MLSLWHKLGPAGTVENIADYAAKHFKEHCRPLRIAVDEPGWRYKNVNQRRTKEIRAGEGGSEIQHMVHTNHRSIS